MQNSFIIAVLLGYILVGAGLVMTLRGIKGVMACLIIGWLFLPPSRGVNLPGLPQFTKEFSVSYAVMLGVLLTDSSRLMSLRLKPIDIPMLIWIVSPLPSSVTNGLGAYDGISGIYFNLFVFGVPYFLGRIFIRTPKDVQTVAIWFVIAGLIAAPMALWESRMSPHLNESVYGYRAAKFHMAKRMGGYRPMLFMRHGLEVGLWMATSSAVALWLWLTSSKQIKIMSFRLPTATTVVLITTILSRSLGSLILLAGTTTTALFVRSTGLRFALIALVLVPTVYLSVRISNVWGPEQLTAIIASFDADRAKSLEARLGQEVDIAQHALKKPLFGWGGNNRFRPTDDFGDVIPVDGMTTITFGKTGFVGLGAFIGFTALPSILVILRIRRRDITSAIWAPTIGIMLGLAIFSIDMMFNAFYTPLHIIGFGVLASVAVQARQWQRTMVYQRRKAMASRHSSLHSPDNSPDTRDECQTNGHPRQAG
jgi:hypothetical protein